jgi:hypothetical protein
MQCGIVSEPLDHTDTLKDDKIETLNLDQKSRKEGSAHFPDGESLICTDQTNQIGLMRTVTLFLKAYIHQYPMHDFTHLSNLPSNISTHTIEKAYTIPNPNEW